MSQNTENYNLYVTSDSSVFVKDWVKEMAGVTDSNMTKIDTVLKEHEDILDNVPILGSDGKIDAAVVPAIAITDTAVVATETAMLALTAQVGDVAVRSDLHKTFILRASPATTLANWTELQTPTDAVSSVAGKTGAVTLTKSDVGLGSADNTADSAKSVASAAKLTTARTINGVAFDGTANVRPGLPFVYCYNDMDNSALPYASSGGLLCALLPYSNGEYSITFLMQMSYGTLSQGAGIFQLRLRGGSTGNVNVIPALNCIVRSISFNQTNPIIGYYFNTELNRMEIYIRPAGKWENIKCTILSAAVDSATGQGTSSMPTSIVFGDSSRATPLPDEYTPLYYTDTAGLAAQTTATTLTNALEYPFNTTVQTPVSVAITARAANTYNVIANVESAAGGSVDDIIVSNKLTNGFKMSFAGSAKSAVIRWTVVGG